MTTTEPVVVEIYHQTPTDEVLMNGTLSSGSASTWLGSEPNGLHWTAPLTDDSSLDSQRNRRRRSGPLMLSITHNKRSCQ